MLKRDFSYTPPAVLGGNLRDYRHPRGADLRARVDGFYKWRNLRQQHGLWPFSRSPEANPAATRGVNFARRDALNLADHSAVKAAAVEAIETFGLQAAGSAAQSGAAELAATLEARIADFVGLADAVLFPTGWAAGYGAIRGLIRATDYVVIDAQAHGGLQEGAAAATRNVYLFRHNDPDECRRWLEKIRAADADNGVLVVTQSLFGEESDGPDLVALRAACDQFDASLLVDAACDLGALGPDGRSALGAQDMLGKADLVVGDFSRVFAADGGFVACRSRETNAYLRAFSPTASCDGLSPIQTATVLKTLDIVDSAEGAELRERLLANVTRLREELAEAGFEVMGAPAPSVCVKLGSEALARLVSRRLPDAGLTAELCEFPAAPKGAARIRMQVTANHTQENIGDAVAALNAAYATACEEAEWLDGERDKLRARA